MRPTPLLGLRGAAWLGILATAGAPAQELAHADPMPVPPAAAIANAQSAALRALTGRIVAISDGSVWRAQHELEQAANATAEPAVKYVLLQEGIALAERAGNPNAALMGIAALARVFAVDEQVLSQQLLLKMREAPRPARVTAAFAALQLARDAAVAPTDAVMLRFHDAALRTALHADDAWVYECVRDRLLSLRAARELWHEARASVSGRLDCAAELAQGVLAASADCSSLARFVQAKPDELDGATVSTLGAARACELAATATNPVVRDGLRRLAIQQLADVLREPVERPDVGATIAELTSLLTTDAGVTALRFRDRAELDQLVRSNGDWRVEDGVLVGGCTGTHNFATHRLSFRSMRSVVIRGGIRSQDGLNFRCKVGDVNLLLNWEVRPENHLWHGGSCTPKGPPALQAGKEHTILFVDVPAGVLVCIDGIPWWTAPGDLAGTVTVYPALGSEIFVREILIDGEPDTLVAGPTGELK